MREARLNFEVVVVGAGSGGMAAACVAAEGGKRVALVDETAWLGGQIWRGGHADAAPWVARFRKSGATLLAGHTILGPVGARILLAEAAEGPREIGWEHLVLATGARELFLPFPGWTLPGVFGVGGLQSLAKHGWPMEGKRVVIAGSGPLLLAVAAGLRKMGAVVLSVNEQAPWSRLLTFGARLAARWPDKLAQALILRRQTRGVAQRTGVWPAEAHGDSALRSVTLTNGARRWTEECDYLACGFGLVPNVELGLALGCQLDNGFITTGNCQETSVANVYAAGELTGIAGSGAAIVQGEIAGLAACGRSDKARALRPKAAKWRQFREALAETFRLRQELESLARPETVVCRCEDVSFEKMKAFESWREAKLQTRCGMGSCQGRVCGAAAKTLFGWGMESVRPPVLPSKVQSLALAGSGDDA